MTDLNYKKNKVIGFVLAYNAAPFLEGLYKRIPKEEFDDIILVDDSSPDDTLKEAGRLGINFFTHEHLGYGGNTKYALKKAMEMGAEFMVEIHGDGQYDPAVIPAALKKMREGYGLILGSRFTDWRQPLRDRMPISKYLANVGLSFIDRTILGVPLTEFHTGFRVYSRRLLNEIDVTHTSDDFLFSFEVIVQARFCGLKIGEVPIRCDYANEHSSISFKKSVLYAFQTLRVLFWYLLARLGFKHPLFLCSSAKKYS
ncbi:MAG: hypothetical protein A3G49_06315 [Candidatus Sungbacteria bacterium RIFCSPLOWO2_12_FULL_41_11]|uniref:Glycosyltransferase 2-like domain-containing protein n=1 Tax=Candidatus Sungbacteria bacterium RIFCSPLOWO2_12_FULL_41_11 TaxID=1802286 RepID=A0A1G2LSF0_9BACT|nr:MAG: family 2 glycosyl transferase [Parcubacteria group bacterium GW2011_GWA2_42_14]OHA14434.1 MAG: hypothetical protein A3G49_06315 [Candidatus Sungbacteria bacterium RIFCSPLOWO2_12_FULL_41_11]